MATNHFKATSTLSPAMSGEIVKCCSTRSFFTLLFIDAACSLYSVSGRINMWLVCLMQWYFAILESFLFLSRWQNVILVYLLRLKGVM